MYEIIATYTQAKENAEPARNIPDELQISSVYNTDPESKAAIKQFVKKLPGMIKGVEDVLENSDDKLLARLAHILIVAGQTTG